MLIQLLTAEWPPYVAGGAGVHVVQLAAALQPRHRVEVVPYPRKSSSNAVAACDYAGRAVAAADRDRPDVLHSHTWFAILAGHAAALTSGAPHVVTMHSVERARPWKQHSRGREYDFSRWVEDTAVPAADAVIAVSHAVAADLREHYPQLSPERIHVVYNGVDTDRWYPDDDPRARVDLGLGPDQRYLVYVGRVSPQKGLLHLLHAFARLPAETALVVFAGAADPPTLARAQTEIERLRAGGRTVVLISDDYDIDRLRPVVSQAELSVVPSSYEPLGMVALEAMACGTPVVAGNVGGLPEVVTPDRGWLCDVEIDPVTRTPADPDGYARDLAAVIERAVADPVARAAGVAGRAAMLQDFAWGPIAEQTVEVYRAVTR